MSDFSTWRNQIDTLLGNANSNLTLLQNPSSSFSSFSPSFSLRNQNSLESTNHAPFSSLKNTLRNGSKNNTFSTSFGGNNGFVAPLAPKMAAANSTFEYSPQTTLQSPETGYFHQNGQQFAVGMSPMESRRSTTRVVPSPSKQAPSPKDAMQDGSMLLNPTIEARLLSVDHEIERFRLQVEDRFQNRITDIDRRHSSIIEDFRTELQIREQEQRKIIRNELQVMRSEVGSKVEEMLLRLRDSDVIYSQMKGMVSSTATKVDLDGVRRDFQDRLSQIITKLDASSTSLLNEMEDRSSKSNFLVEKVVRDMAEKNYRDISRAEEFDLKLKATVNRDEWQRQIEMSQTQQTKSEQLLRLDNMNSQNMIKDTLNTLKMQDDSLLSTLDTRCQDLRNLFKEYASLRQYEMLKSDCETQNSLLTDRISKFKDDFNSRINSMECDFVSKFNKCFDVDREANGFLRQEVSDLKNYVNNSIQKLQSSFSQIVSDSNDLITSKLDEFEIKNKLYISEVKADILAETSLIEANLNNMVQDQIKQSFESTRSEQTKNDDRIMEHVQSEMEGLYKKLLDFQDAAKEDHDSLKKLLDTVNPQFEKQNKSIDSLTALYEKMRLSWSDRAASLESTLKSLGEQIALPMRLETSFQLYESRMNDYEHALESATKQIRSRRVALEQSVLALEQRFLNLELSQSVKITPNNSSTEKIVNDPKLKEVEPIKSAEVDNSTKLDDLKSKYVTKSPSSRVGEKKADTLQSDINNVSESSKFVNLKEAVNSFVRIQSDNVVNESEKSALPKESEKVALPKESEKVESVLSRGNETDKVSPSEIEKDKSIEPPISQALTESLVITSQSKLDKIEQVDTKKSAIKLTTKGKVKSPVESTKSSASTKSSNASKSKTDEIKSDSSKPKKVVYKASLLDVSSDSKPITETIVKEIVEPVSSAAAKKDAPLDLDLDDSLDEFDDEFEVSLDFGSTDNSKKLTPAKK